ncbi:putative F-box/FBD/LRR-repeat protein At4g03220 [Miscanthus floridulus]|uniref:putative F-box/FBD/LRR-repeat protein At4g03220 n=1 Tax=Miscanthus floridulus TaxID=154761 RepID=UPI0034590B46
MARNGRVRVSRSGDSKPGDSQDRISALPDSILHQILVLVPLVDAVRTCVLSRHWRGVWTRLPLLFFDDVQAPRVSRFPDLVDGVLRGYADDVDMGDLFVSVYRRDSVGDDPISFVSTLADLAAQRISGRFSLYLSPAAVTVYPEEFLKNLFPDPEDDEEEEEAVTLQLPCFPRVTELSITFMGVDLGLPTTDTFAMLTKLFISGVRFTDGGEEISQVVSLCCPCIERLELHRIGGLRRLTVFAQSLVSMVLSRILVLEQLLVAAENLRHMLVDKCFVLSITRAFMFLSVPALEQLLWQDRCPEVIQHWMLPRCLQRLVVAELELSYLFGAGGRSNFARILQLFKCVDTLRLEFPTSQDRTDQESLIENVNLPCYSELEFIVNHTRHRFGPTILNLLRKCSCVKKVTLQMFGREVGYIPCASNCSCRQLSVWTDKAINLDSLECVAMYEFRATQDERSFIYYIMRNAKRLRKLVSVYAAELVSCQQVYKFM